jgi:quercetin dioxygenase-like cupin family protein
VGESRGKPDLPGPNGELGEVGQKIIFENETIRVWEIVLEPGERQPAHRHDHPYVVITIEGSSNVIETASGERREVEEATGGVVFRAPGEVHTLTNVGDRRYVNRLVELKHV